MIEIKESFCLFAFIHLVLVIRELTTYSSNWSVPGRPKWFCSHYKSCVSLFCISHSPQSVQDQPYGLCYTLFSDNQNQNRRSRFSEFQFLFFFSDLFDILQLIKIHIRYVGTNEVTQVAGKISYSTTAWSLGTQVRF